VLTALVASPNADAPLLPTALIASPNAEAPLLPTALIASPNADAPAVPTALVASPSHVPDAVPTALVMSPAVDDPAPTALVMSPNAELDPVPTALNMTPNVLAPLPNRPSAPRKPGRAAAPTPRSMPLPAHAAPDAVKTVNARPQTQAPEEPDGAPTGREEAPFAETGRVASPFPVDTKRSAKAARAAPVETREAPKVSDTQDEDQNATGRVVAPYRAAKPDADTGKVAVPFRAVEAPFAVDEEDAGEPEPHSEPSVPMAVSKKRKGSTGTFDEQPELSAAGVAAPFPVGHTPPPKRAAAEGRNRALLVAGALILVFFAASSTLLLVNASPKSIAREAAVHDASAQYQAKPGHVRVGARCGSKPIVARLFVHGVDKGDTPVEVALPTGLPAGEQVLELHVAGRFGDPMDARYHYRLPLEPGKPGEAIEVELEGCTPKTMGK